MAKQEWVLRANFNALLYAIDDGIVRGSMTAKLEDSSSFSEGGAQCAVRVYERYSWFGGNRLSLTVTLFQAAGGSQAMFFKVNTVGEAAFLSKLRSVVERFRAEN